MNGRLILTLVIALALLVGSLAVGCGSGDEPQPTATPKPTTGETPKPTTGETVKIGFLGSFSGVESMWYAPGKTGLQMWEDEVNAAGGIEVQGVKHPVEVVYYDMEGTTSKAITGAKQLILQDKIKMLIMCCGAPVASIQPFINDQEVLLHSIVQYESYPDRPWVLGIGEAAPFYSGFGMQYMADKYPQIERVAVLGQDEEVNLKHTCWTLAGCESAGLEVVYNKPFAVDTVDFAPIVSAVLATDPDLISMPAAWPEFRALIVEQCYLQGYEGLFESSECEIDAIAAKVPIGYIDGFLTYRPGYLNDPALPQKTRDYFETWMARYGPGGTEDIGREPMPIDHQYANAAWVWQYGVELADSFEPRAVRDALLAQEEVPHQLGTGTWWGEPACGVNHLLTTDTGMVQIYDGKPVTQAWFPETEWLEAGNNLQLAFKYLDQYGLR
jgi:branched-chain amino acid transport system substrate-binding protein